jgi:hypothetical protein
MYEHNSLETPSCNQNIYINKASKIFTYIFGLVRLVSLTGGP